MEKTIMVPELSFITDYYQCWVFLFWNGENTQMVGKLFMSESMNGNLPNFYLERFGEFLLRSFSISTFFISSLTCFGFTTWGTKLKVKGWKFFVTFLAILAVCSNFPNFWFQGQILAECQELYMAYSICLDQITNGSRWWFSNWPTIAMIMFGFFAICFTGIFGGVANWAHAGGLLVGLGWGSVQHLLESRKNVI